MQVWLWVGYALVSLTLIAVLAYWNRRRQWRWRLLAPLLLLLVWPQPEDAAWVPYWVGLLATLWSQVPVAIPWLLFPGLGFTFWLGLRRDQHNNSNVRQRGEGG